jgi:hypothetical protein
MVVEPDATRADLTEAVLARCRFAVAPVVSVEAAVTVSRTLQPAVIVCDPSSVDRMRKAVTIPVVSTRPDNLGELIEPIRLAIRQAARHIKTF